MSMTVCMRALNSVSRILFSVQMMSDGSLLTECSRLVGHSCLCRPSDVVVASMVKLSMIRRDVYSTQLSFNFAGVMLQISLTFLRKCPAVHSVQFLYFLSTAAEV